MVQLKEINARIAGLTAENRRLMLETANQASALRRKDEEIRALNLHIQTERLTGLMTRDFFEDQVDGALKSTENRRVQDATLVDAFVIIDVDRFKELNDTYGHPVGDKVLAHLGKIIRDSIRDYDFAARFGGDEFVVFFSGIQSKELAEQKMLTMRSQFEKWLAGEFSSKKSGTLSSRVSFSFGIVVASDELDSFASLYQDADHALYAQKRERRSVR